MWRTALALLLLAAGVPLAAAQQSQCTPQNLAAPATITLGTVEVEGGQELSATAVAATRAAFKKPVYRLCELKDALAEAAEHVRRIYQEHGYFKAAVEDPLTRPAGGGKLDVVIPVTPGAIYRLQDISFTHVTAFPVERLRPLFALQPGNVFNAVTFSQGLERLRQLYVSQGYINSAPVPSPVVDDTNKSIAWTIDMDEGPVFTLGTLILDGAEPVAGVGRRLVADWQPLMGQVYSPELLKRFLQEHAALLRMRNPDPQSMFDALLDNRDHIATMRLHFPN